MELQKTGLSVQVPSSVATVVHQIMTELSKAVPEGDLVTAITKLVLNATKWLRPLKVIAINANDIWRQRYELSQAFDS
jgi:trans-aconitate methyltransferase